MHRRAVTGAMPQAGVAPVPARARIAWPRLARRTLRGAVVAAGLGLVLLALGFLWFLEATAAPPDDPGRQTDGIVVLTGGGDRVRTALELLVGHAAGRLLVSGAHPDVTLADLAALSGLPVSSLQARVTLGRAARSTRGNAVETAAWVRAEGLDSIRVVTAGYHMPRAVLELRRQLPPEVEVITHPVMPAGLRDAAAPTRMRTWILLASEYAKLIGAMLGLGGETPAQHATGR